MLSATVTLIVADDAYNLQALAVAILPAIEGVFQEIRLQSDPGNDAAQEVRLAFNKTGIVPPAPIPANRYGAVLAPGESVTFRSDRNSLFLSEMFAEGKTTANQKINIIVEAQ